MLPQANRLKKTIDFQKVFKRGKSATSASLTVRYLSKNANLPARFGFVVSTKVDKRASKRNMIKRQMRAASKDLISNLKQGYDVVVLASRVKIPVDKKQIRTEVGEVYKKAGLIQ